MSLIVEKDKPSYSSHIRFFRPSAIVPHSNGIANLIQQLRILLTGFKIIHVEISIASQAANFVIQPWAE